MTLTFLYRVRWAVRATLALGVAASVAANILHAQPQFIARTIAAWPPLALLITVELVSHIPVHRKGLGAVRILATTAIASIAAYVSYLHMVGVVARYGETGAVPYLLPLSVDGLIVVASVSLVELGARIRDLATTTPRAEASHADTGHARPGADPAHRPPPGQQWPVPGAAPPANGATPTALGCPSTVPAVTVAERAAPHRPPQRDPGASQPLERDHRAQLLAASDLDEEAEAVDEPDSDGAPDRQVRPPEPAGAQHVAGLAPDLVPLLPIARQVRDELRREGRPLSRDALAARMRRGGHSIRTRRVSELLAALKAEAPSVNGFHPEPRSDPH
jgi:hypothetical protein